MRVGAGRGGSGRVGEGVIEYIIGVGRGVMVGERERETKREGLLREVKMKTAKYILREQRGCNA